MAIQRAKDKTEELQARASAIDELTASGALEDFSDNRTQLDRELAQISATSQVDDELAKLKAEVGAGRARRRRSSRARPCDVVGLGDVLFGRKKLKEPGARPALRAHDGRGHARRRVRAQARRRRRRRLQAALGRRVHAGRQGRRAAARRASPPASGSKLERKTGHVRLRVGDRARPGARGPGDGGLRASRSEFNGARLRRASSSPPRSASRAASIRSTGSTASRPARSGRSSRPARSRSATTPRELELKAQLEKELPVEPDLTQVARPVRRADLERNRACPSRGRSPRGPRGASRAAGDP